MNKNTDMNEDRGAKAVEELTDEKMKLLKAGLDSLDECKDVYKKLSKL